MTMTKDVRPHLMTHLGATVVPGPHGTAHMVCDGCGHPFPAWRHPVERDQWESPDWEAHAKVMRGKVRRRAFWRWLLGRRS